MIRVSEMVLPGHPDKFCDQVADAIIAGAWIDADAYGQVEVSTWSDHVWLSGGICTRRPLEADAGRHRRRDRPALGYGRRQPYRRRRYKVTSTVCQRIGDPARWSAPRQRPGVVVGWAGYDAKDGLPAARALPRPRLPRRAGRILPERAAQGPGAGRKAPGEDERRRRPLVARACPGDDPAAAVRRLMDVCAAMAGVARGRVSGTAGSRPALARRLARCRGDGQSERAAGRTPAATATTARRAGSWSWISTARAFPIGGGALSGKHLTHIDRIGAYAARDAAVRAVTSGAEECLVRLAYAPNVPDRWTSSTKWCGGGNAKPGASSITAKWSGATRRRGSRAGSRKAGISSTGPCPGTRAGFRKRIFPSPGPPERQNRCKKGAR